MNHCESVQQTEDGEGLETTGTLYFGVYRLFQTLATIRVQVFHKHEC